jgi:transcriptional regulator with XRE-family HTH domain
MELKQRRLENGWSQQQLAEISGLSVRTVQRIENGDTPGLETIKALSASFGISSSEFQNGSNAIQEHTDMQNQNPKIVHDLGFLASIDRAWKRVIIHIGVFAFFMTWLVVLDRFIGLGGDIVGIIAVIWGPLLAYHAISALNGMGNEPSKGDGDNSANKVGAKTET